VNKELSHRESLGLATAAFLLTGFIMVILYLLMYSLGLTEDAPMGLVATIKEMPPPIAVTFALFITSAIIGIGFLMENKEEWEYYRSIIIFTVIIDILLIFALYIASIFTYIPELLIKEIGLTLLLTPPITYVILKSIKYLKHKLKNG